MIDQSGDHFDIGIGLVRTRITQIGLRSSCNRRIGIFSRWGEHFIGADQRVEAIINPGEACFSRRQIACSVFCQRVQRSQTSRISNLRIVGIGDRIDKIIIVRKRCIQRSKRICQIGIGIGNRQACRSCHILRSGKCISGVIGNRQRIGAGGLGIIQLALCIGARSKRCVECVEIILRLIAIKRGLRSVNIGLSSGEHRRGI